MTESQTRISPPRHELTIRGGSVVKHSTAYKSNPFKLRPAYTGRVTRGETRKMEDVPFVASAAAASAC